MDVQESSILKVEVCTTDKPALGAVGRMFMELAGLSLAAGVIAELKPLAPGYPGEFVAGVSELQAGNFSPEAVAAALAAFNEQGQPGAPVDTAAVFAGLPGGNVTEAPTTPQAPTPPAPAAPTPPTPPTPPAPGAVELDKQGLPWDSRINTGNKAKTNKGIWKMSKGLPEGVYDAVVAELKQVMALSAGQPAAPAAPTPPTPPTPPAPAAPIAGVPGMTHSYTMPGVGGTFITAPGEPVPAGGVLVSTQPMPQPAAPAAPTPPTPPVPPTPVAGAEEAPTTYAQLLQHITKHMSAQKITSDEINLVCAQNGLPSLNMAANAPQLIPAIYTGCAAIWNSRP